MFWVVVLPEPVRLRELLPQKLHTVGCQHLPIKFPIHISLEHNDIGCPSLADASPNIYLKQEKTFEIILAIEN